MAPVAFGRRWCSVAREPMLGQGTVAMLALVTVASNPTTVVQIESAPGMQVFADDLAVELGYRLVDHEVTTASTADASLSWTVLIAAEADQLQVVVLDPGGDEVRRWSLPRLERLELETRRAAVLIEGALRFDLEQLAPPEALARRPAPVLPDVEAPETSTAPPGAGSTPTTVEGSAPLGTSSVLAVAVEMYGGLGGRVSASGGPKMFADLAASVRLGRWLEVEAFGGSELWASGPEPVAARQSWVGALVGLRIVDGAMGVSAGVGPNLVLLETRADSGQLDRRWQPSLRAQVRGFLGLTSNLLLLANLSLDVLGRRPVYFVEGNPFYSPGWVQTGLTVGVGYRL